MTDEDRKLQIDLAKLQTDVQISLTYAVSIIAIWFGLFITFQQMLVQESNALLKLTYGLAMGATAVFGLLCTYLFIQKMQKSRNEMEKLRKEYLKPKTKSVKAEG